MQSTAQIEKTKCSRCRKNSILEARIVGMDFGPLCGDHWYNLKVQIALLKGNIDWKQVAKNEKVENNTNKSNNKQMTFTCLKCKKAQEVEKLSRFQKYCTECKNEVKRARKEARQKLRKSMRIRTKDVEEVPEE